MKYAVVMNAFTGNCAAKAREMNGFLHQAGFPGLGGTTILFYGDGEDRAALLPLVPTPSVILVRVARHQPEQALGILEELAPGVGAGLYLCSDDGAGRELAVRLACRLGGTSLTGVRELALDADGVRCTKAVYSGHLEATFGLRRTPCCLSIAKGCADPLPVTGAGPQVLMDLDRRAALPAWVESAELVPDTVPGGLESSKFILAVGMGAQNRERAARLCEIARDLGADLGASRPVVMNAWVPMHRLVGVSGAMTRPRLCIVAGASGSAAFMAGIEKSRFIVAVNQDDQAPILGCCDVGVVGDCLEVLEELARIVKAEGA